MITSQTVAGIKAAPPVWEPTVELGAFDEVDAAEGVDEAEDDELEPAPALKSSVRPRPKRANSTANLLIVSALVAFGGVGFAVGHASAGGSSTALSGATTASRFVPLASGAPGVGEGGGLGGGGTVTGTVVSVAAGSITLKLASGQTETVATGSTTTYHNQTAGSATDLAAGQTVQVQTTRGATAGQSAAASPGATTTRTATSVTITAN
jgi:hypothetical protein